ncbi:ExeM/NucH family extracellular endonuclease [Nocardioides euryhalodurans]|uniref:ExeM/NucH family extracellular endonuclease n=1 Tax=Nocardioides euryhalodurans TaxID=2518370 RepID=A0A4P7GID0_9ACTN|nr:ExeM/NucH family extracellular endonuclease [Nocardioides euryhalodurans]QBR91447.1 ExeM/NucH family extracellular endonuclease [Nocardioides euryhalodurans]
MRTSRPAALIGGLSLVAGGLSAALIATPAAAVPGAGSAVFVNEIHYDNDGTDAGEFIEIANPAGADLTGWSVVLYNGSNGATYDTDALSGTGQVQALTYAANGIQNGSPDAVALVDAAGSVVQLLSYEGTLTATNGPAAGQTSTDIGLSEAGSEPLGQSLQLTGTGATYGDFTWTGPADDSPGTANTGQTFTGGGGPAQPVADCGDGPLAVDTDASGSREVSAVDADSRIVTAEITSDAVQGISLDGFTASAADGEPATATLNVADTTPDGTYEVDIELTTDDDPAQTATCSVTVVVSDQDAVTPISTIQGDGDASTLVGERVNVEAVVTSVITANDVTDGFFLQEEDADADTDPATSEGIYVFCRNACPDDLAAGDRYRVSGEVAEFNTTTQVAAAFGDGSFELLESGAPLPTAAVVELPADASTEDPTTFEDVEGMRTTISTTLAVSEYFNQARFGEIVLTAEERPYQFTQLNEPSEAGYAAHLADVATRQIILDDDSNSQNAATSGPENNEPYYYPTPGLSTGNFFRGGDTITELTGVFEYAFGAWKVRPVAGADYTFESANPRPAGPDEVGGRIQVASFNVLNYFTSIDDGADTCGPAADQECRGADSQAELDNQRAKIVDALARIDAEVVGLIEIQNDGDDASVADLVAALNEREGAGTYAYVATGFIGTDAIKQAFIYQPAAVQPVGDFDLLTSADDPRFDDESNRPALIQTFEEVETDERLTIAVNHLKSKGSGCGAGDDSPLDGSGNCDGTRTAAAQALVDHLASDPTGSGDPDTLIIGDLNSYAMERPISTLREAGYTDLLQRFEGDDAYGYLFDGQLGTLDHGLATATLDEQVTGAGGWKINADENPLFDYNDTVHDTAGEPDFERKSTALPLFEPNAFRSSDHDPVVIGLDLGDPRETVQMDIDLRPGKVEVGKTRPRLVVEVEDDDDRRQVVSGVVQVSFEDEVRTETLQRGKALFELGTFDTPGEVVVTVEYLGSQTHAPSTETFTFEVREGKNRGSD